MAFLFPDTLDYIKRKIRCMVHVLFSCTQPQIQAKTSDIYGFAPDLHLTEEQYCPSDYKDAYHYLVSEEQSETRREKKS